MLMATEIRHKSECLPTAWLGTYIRSRTSVDSNMFRTSPCPLESHLAALPRALQWAVILVNSSVLHQIFVRQKLKHSRSN
ncbi:hypothetical protein S83_009196 [Arachis hypogaea]